MSSNVKNAPRGRRLIAACLVAVGIVAFMYGRLVWSFGRFQARPDLVSKLQIMTVRFGVTAAVVAVCLVLGAAAWSNWRRAPRNTLLLAALDVALFLGFVFAPWLVGVINTSGVWLGDPFEAWVDPGFLMSALPSLAALAGIAVSWILGRVHFHHLQPAA